MSEYAVQPLTGERQPKETDAAVLACNDYLRLGIGRSLRGLLAIYRQQTDSRPPTVRERTLALWSTEFNWQERASAYDAQQDAVRTAEINRIRTEGLAAEHERIRRLTRLADDLEAQYYYCGELDDDGNELAPRPAGDTVRYELQAGRRPHLWVRDVKQIGGGEFARQVTIYRYNSQLVSDYRGVLDDIAKETGGRKSQHEISGPDGGAIPLTFMQTLDEAYGGDDE